MIKKLTRTIWKRTRENNELLPEKKKTQPDLFLSNISQQFLLELLSCGFPLAQLPKPLNVDVRLILVSFRTVRIELGKDTSVKNTKPGIGFGILAIQFVGFLYRRFGLIG